VDQVVAALKTAGLGYTPPIIQGDRRILEIDPKAANMVPLFIFDRRV